MYYPGAELLNSNKNTIEKIESIEILMIDFKFLTLKK